MRRYRIPRNVLLRTLHLRSARLRPYRRLAFHTFNGLPSYNEATVPIETGPGTTLLKNYDHNLPNVAALRAMRLRLPESHLKEEIFHLRQTGTEPPSYSYELFVEALGMASGPFSPLAYSYVVSAWKAAFRAGSLLDEHQLNRYLTHTDRVIHVMINRGDYKAYELYVKPVLPHDEPRLRAQQAMDTFQFQWDSKLNKVQISNQAVLYFRSQDTQQNKHELLALYLRKMMLYFSTVVPLAELFDLFMEYVTTIEPFSQTFVPDGSKLVIYAKSLRLFISSQKEGSHDRLHLMRQVALAHIDMSSFGNFLTCLMKVTAHEAPRTALSLWQYKVSLRKESDKFRLTSNDLSHVMVTLLRLKDYDRAMELYLEYPQFHHVDQIETILEISSRQRAWQALQDQFEDMYGKKSLPRLVHYTIVVRALASIGARTEIERLMQQLRSRNLSPNVYMYRALLEATTCESGLKGAHEIYLDFLEDINSGFIPRSDAYKLLASFLDAVALQEDQNAVIKAAMNFLEWQRQGRGVFVDEDTLLAVFKYASALSSLDLFESGLKMARELKYMTDRIYHACITFLTKMGHFQRAEDLVKEAHENLDIPYQNSHILAAQLKNYRVWIKEDSSYYLRIQIAAESRAILSQVNEGLFSPKNKEDLFAECAKFCISTCRISIAENYLKAAWMSHNVKERHFAPLLQYHWRLSDAESPANILAIYENMVEKKVELTAKTYFYIISALVDVDWNRKNHFESSTKILRSVLKRYGIMPESNIETDSQEKSDYKVPTLELTRNAVALLRTLSYYVRKVATPYDTLDAFALEVVNRLKARLGTNISVEFRRPIHQALAQLYLASREFILAEKYIDIALGEFSAIFSEFAEGEPLPKLLFIEYSEAIDIKNRVMALRKAPSKQYIAVFDTLLKYNIFLDRIRIERLFKGLLGSRPLAKAFGTMLRATETFLIAGNMADVRLFRLIGNVYRQFILYQAQNYTRAELDAKYGILNRYYNVNIKRIIQSEASYLARVDALERDMRLLPHDFQRSLDALMTNPGDLFVPGRVSWHKHYLNSELCSKLLNLFDRFCTNKRELAFKLYEQFPETIEYLLIFRLERFRYVAFLSELRALGAAINQDSREALREQMVDKVNEHLFKNDII